MAAAPTTRRGNGNAQRSINYTPAQVRKLCGLIEKGNLASNQLTQWASGQIALGGNTNVGGGRSAATGTQRRKTGSGGTARRQQRSMAAGGQQQAI